MTVSHCSIVAYTYRATFSSRATPHDRLEAPGFRPRSTPSDHVNKVYATVCSEGSRFRSLIV